MNITSIYTYDKIISLFKNFDTLSFIDLIINYDELIDRGYNKIFLKAKFTFNAFNAFFSIYYDQFSINFDYEHFKAI